MPRVAIVSAPESRAEFGSRRRLHRPAEFSAVIAGRKVVRGKSFDLHYHPTRSVEGSRLGLIVPKRMARDAVLRNAIKRQGREAFRLMAVGISSPCDLVLRLTRPVVRTATADMALRRVWRAEIETLFRRLPG